MAIAAQTTDANGVPVSSGYKPDSGNTVPVQSSQRTKTDTVSNTYAPPVVETVNQEYVRLGLMYIATTGKLATATNPTLIMGASLFNPAASGKTIVVLSARLMQSAAQADMHLNLTTVDPAFATALTPACLLTGGGVGSVASVTGPAAGATASVSLTNAGTAIDYTILPGADVRELIPPDSGIILPAGTAHGVALFQTIAVAGGTYTFTFRWVEY